MEVVAVAMVGAVVAAVAAVAVLIVEAVTGIDDTVDADVVLDVVVFADATTAVAIVVVPLTLITGGYTSKYNRALAP